MVLALGTCALKAETNSAPAAARPCCQEIKSDAPLSDRSVYQLNSEWTNDFGRTVKLADLRGKPQVVAMFYSSCQSACPMLVFQMQQVADSLPANARTNVGFLLVTFDTEHDTPETLHAYRTARKLDESQWTLLRGRPEDVRELALVLGVKYRQDAQGQFSHSNLITILNADGEIAFQQTGLNNPPSQIKEQVTRLLKQ
jgi:protein SCO1/2